MEHQLSRSAPPAVSVTRDQAIALGNSAHQLHHSCYWASNLDSVAARLEAIGFERELTPVHNGPELLEFCYLRNASGTRIEIQSSSDKTSVHDWISKGTPEHLSWIRYTKSPVMSPIAE